MIDQPWSLRGSGHSSLTEPWRAGGYLSGGAGLERTGAESQIFLSFLLFFRSFSGFAGDDGVAIGFSGDPAAGRAGDESSLMADGG